MIRTDGEKVDFYELDFHVDGVLKEDKQEISLSQVIYRNKKLEKVKSLREMMAEIIIVSQLNLVDFAFRFFFVFNLSLFLYSLFTIYHLFSELALI